MKQFPETASNPIPVVIVLLGPTASGKTALAIDLAEKFDLSVMNIDSRQVYKGMDIGTAKPTQAQQKRVRHHLLNLRDPNNPITVQEFKAKANAEANKIIQSKKIVFLVGGSGLYLKAITQGLCPPAVAPQHFLRSQLQDIGQNVCHELLKIVDPASASKIPPKDEIRTQRALEVFYATGKTIRSQQSSDPPIWKILELGLNPPDLKNRISIRTASIYANGLLEETEVLMQSFGAELPLLQTIGYGEALRVIKGQLTINDAIEITKHRTNQFAKRQMTWFRGQHQAKWLNNDEPFKEAFSIIKGVLG